MDFSILKPLIPWFLAVWALNGLLDFVARIINRKVSEELIQAQRNLISAQENQIQTWKQIAAGNRYHGTERLG